MQNTPPDNNPTRRSAEPSKSQTIQPDGRSSQRSSPPPLYPDGGYPLPNHVDEVDLNGTRVSPAALTDRAVRHSPPGGTPAKFNGAATWGCFVRGVIAVIFGLAALFILSAIALVFAYYWIARDLPSVSDLRQRSALIDPAR